MIRKKTRLLAVWLLLVLFTWAQGMAGSVQYTYDNLNRLTKVEREDGTVVEYTYDAAGNRLTKTVAITNTAPNVPSNPSPADGATGVSCSTGLSWSGGDPDAGDVLTYDVYLGKATPLSAPVSQNQSATSFSPGSSLEPGTDYYWKVVAKDQHGATQEGPVWHFVTAAAQSADLSITMKDSADPAKFNVNLTYTLTVSNAGPGEATGVSVVDTLPAAVAFVKATTTQGECTYSSPTVQCSLGTVQPGAVPKITIVVKPKKIGTITNVAEVSANETDPNTANSHASEQTAVKYVANLSITGSDLPDPVKVGAKLTYTLTINNAGPKKATNVVVADTLPAGVAFVSKQTSQGSCTRSGRTLTCNLGTVPKGGTPQIILKVKPKAAGTITNIAKVKGEEIDPVAANNKITLETKVEAVLPAAAE